MIKLQDIRYLLEPLLELRDLLEVVPELDDWRSLEHSMRVDHQLPMLQRIDVALDEQQVRAVLHGEETAPGDVDALWVLEVLDRGACGRLELDDSKPVLGDLGVNDEVKLHGVLVHYTLQSCCVVYKLGSMLHDQKWAKRTFQVDPQIVRVEYLELANRFEVFRVL